MNKELCNTADRKLFQILHIMEMFLFCPHVNIYRPRNTSNTNSLKFLNWTGAPRVYVTSQLTVLKTENRFLPVFTCVYIYVAAFMSETNFPQDRKSHLELCIMTQKEQGHVWWMHVLWHWWWPFQSHLEQTVDNGSQFTGPSLGRCSDGNNKLHPNQNSDRWQHTGIKQTVSCSTENAPMAHRRDPWITDHLIFRMTELMGDKLAQTADWTMKRTQTVN